MKALSLTQPWASLVAIGAKEIETRSWPTRYQHMPLAIHASKGFPIEARARCAEPGFLEHLQAIAEFVYDTDRLGMLIYKRGLPLGAIVAVADLLTCQQVDRVRDHLTDQEYLFGDYRDGRWAWLLHNVRPLAMPIPCLGALGLWHVPEEIARQLEAL